MISGRLGYSTSQAYPHLRMGAAWQDGYVDYAGASIPEDFGPEALSAEWFIVIDTPERFEFEQELALETVSGHPLHGVDVEVVAFRRQKREIIGWVSSAQSWACVHLTWRAEINPNYPSTILLDDWPGVLAELAERGRH